MRGLIPFLLLLSAGGPLAGSTVSIVRHGDSYSLLRNGQPYFVKGAVGAVHLEELVAAGGNSIRADPAALDRAQALGLSVLVDLPFGKQRWGFNYGDPAAVNRQREARSNDSAPLRALEVNVIVAGAVNDQELVL